MRGVAPIQHEPAIPIQYHRRTVVIHENGWRHGLHRQSQREASCTGLQRQREIGCRGFKWHLNLRLRLGSRQHRKTECAGIGGADPPPDHTDQRSGRGGAGAEIRGVHQAQSAPAVRRGRGIYSVAIQSGINLIAVGIQLHVGRRSRRKSFRNRRPGHRGRAGILQVGGGKEDAFIGGDVNHAGAAHRRRYRGPERPAGWKSDRPRIHRCWWYAARARQCRPLPREPRAARPDRQKTARQARSRQGAAKQSSLRPRRAKPISGHPPRRRRPSAQPNPRR